MKLTVDYNYAGFTLEIKVDASPAEPQTLEEPGCDAEFCITEILLDGKCAMELIGWDEYFSEEDQCMFEEKVEAKYIEEQQ